MTVASTSTSSSVLIQLYDNESGTSFEVPAYESSEVSGSINLTLSGIVDERHTYRVTLFSPFEISLDSVGMSVNGDDFIDSFLEESSQCGKVDNPYVYDLTFPRGINTKQRGLFYLTYGLVRIEFSIAGVGRFITMDIPCICADTVQKSEVRSMLETLLDSGEQTVADWMFVGDSNEIDRYAVLESGTGQRSSKSLTAFIALITDTLDTYQACLAYMRSSAHCTVNRDNTRQSGMDVRQFGVKEFGWLMKNGEALSEVEASTGLLYNGRNYFPRYIRTERKSKSFNNYENQVVLGFLSEVMAATRTAEAKMSEGKSSTDRYISGLHAIGGNQELPALVVMEECARRVQSLASTLRSLKTRAQRLQTIYRSILPGVKPNERAIASLRRTKVFQEVHAYSEIYRMADRWRAFDDFSLARESLALHVIRLDKLYEYYALFKLLEALHQNGYELDPIERTPIERAVYSLVDSHYDPEETVNTLYRMSSAGRRIVLYYQPVIYGDDHEEHGITFHRKSSRFAFESQHDDSYYTPDYLLTLEYGGERRSFILDAKYSDIAHLTKGGRNSNRFNRFNQTQYKYQGDIMDSSRRSPDAVWLLAGKEEGLDLRPYHSGTWASKISDLTASGIAPLSPTADSLDALFELLGITTRPLKDEPHIEESNDTNMSDAPSVNSEEAALYTNPTVAENPDNSNTDATEVIAQKDSELSAVSFGDGQHVTSSKLVGNLTPETLQLVLEFIEGHTNVEELYKQPWSARNLGVNHPILRGSLPKRSREKQLYSVHEFYFGIAYFYTGWRTNQISRLKRLIAKREKRA